MRRVFPSGTLLAVALATSAAASAQVPAGRRELVGLVRDPRGVAIEGATVEVPGAGARTDTGGMFRLFTGDVDTLTIAVRRPGYSPVQASITARNRQWDTLKVKMEALAATLPTARVEEERVRRGGLRGFYERLARHQQGLFITREEIVARGASRLTDVLQTRRGIQLVRLSNTRNGVRFVTYAGSRGRACIPDLWVDGQFARSMEVDDLPPNTVEAMELYDSFAAVPFEFSPNVNAVPCGTIIVWTRPPNTKEPARPPSDAPSQTGTWPITNVEASARPIASSQAYSRCRSRGALEARLLDTIKAQLK